MKTTKGLFIQTLLEPKQLDVDVILFKNSAASLLRSISRLACELCDGKTVRDNLYNA